MLSPTFSPVPKSSSSPSAAGPSVSTPIGTTNARAGMRESTVLAYAKDVRLFIQAGGCIPCDAALVLRYVAATRQTVAPTTLHRRLMAIAHEHRARGLPSPIDDPEVRPLARALQLGQVPGKDLSIPATKSKSLCSVAEPHSRDPYRYNPRTSFSATFSLAHTAPTLRYSFVADRFNAIMASRREDPSSASMTSAGSASVFLVELQRSDKGAHPADWGAPTALIRSTAPVTTPRTGSLNFGRPWLRASTSG